METQATCPSQVLFFLVPWQKDTHRNVVRSYHAGKSTSRKVDEMVKEMKDQVIRAKVYLNFLSANSSSHIVKELKLRIKEIERAMTQSTRDSRVSKRHNFFFSS